MNTTMHDHSRRNFLKASTAFGAITILPSSRLFGKDRAVAISPNEKINLAIIGIGNQGNGDRDA